MEDFDVKSYQIKVELGRTLAWLASYALPLFEALGWLRRVSSTEGGGGGQGG